MSTFPRLKDKHCYRLLLLLLETKTACISAASVGERGTSFTLTSFRGFLGIVMTRNRRISLSLAARPMKHLGMTIYRCYQVDKLFKRSFLNLRLLCFSIVIQCELLKTVSLPCLP